MFPVSAQSFRIEIRSFSDTDPKILEQIGRAGHLVLRDNGQAYLRIGESVYSCEDSPAAIKLLDACRLGLLADREINSEEKAWQALLKGTADPLQVAQKYGMQNRCTRSVILFRPLSACSYSDLRDSIPLEEPDRFFPLENGDAVLLLGMKKRSSDEVAEFVSAAAEMMESEAGISCYAGIANPAESLSRLPAAYREAEAAIETGIRHKLPGRVFDYRRQTLERLVDMIPEVKAKQLLEELLNEEASAVLNGEILETIRVFLRNDLNLSTTARELFVHRNTLIYRMEKIRKATGLDLRKFEDAAVFRILMSMKDATDSSCMNT